MLQAIIESFGSKDNFLNDMDDAVTAIADSLTEERFCKKSINALQSLQLLKDIVRHEK